MKREPPAQSGRNGFLDVVRTVAILRVLVWHAYGTAWISFFIASMPAMFFVAGTLMAGSLDRSGGLKVLRDRFQRLLIPLWVFSVLVIAVMATYAARRPDPAGDLDWARLIFWFFPVWDPQGSEWGVTWWAALWYLRCTTWLILLSPLLLWLMRRMWAPVLLAPLGAVFLLELASRRGLDVRWQWQDLALYSFFWMLGFAFRDGRLGSLPRVGRAGIALVSAAAAAAWAITQDVPGNIVNSSYPLHLFVGTAWLFGALTFEGEIAKVATVRLVRPIVSWVNQRALSIYLWHAAGLFAAYHLLWRGSISERERLWLVLPVVAVVTFACVLVFGWIEDASGRRPMRIWPGGLGPPGRWRVRRAGSVAAIGAVCVAGFGVLLLTAANVREEAPGALSVARAAPPSGVGLKLRTARAQITADAPERQARISTEPVTREELDAVLASWVKSSNVKGASVALLRGDGSGWSGAAGINKGTGKPSRASDVNPIASVTKTFTGALILQLVDEGMLSLDDPLNLFVPDFPRASEITIRQLLQHRSGVIGTDGASPFDALQAAAKQPLVFEPGTGFEYSAPGYFLLGLVVEKVTGQSYTSALHSRILDPLELTATKMDEELHPLRYSTHPYRGIPSTSEYGGVLWSSGGLYASAVPSSDYRGVLWSAGGLQSTVVNLAYWGILLWDSGAVISAESLNAMTTFLGPEFEYSGLATYPFCPCWVSDGRLRGERWGHLGSTGVLEYDPTDRVSISIYTYTTESALDERLIVAFDELSRKLRDLIRGRALPDVPRR